MKTILYLILFIAFFLNSVAQQVTVSDNNSCSHAKMHAVTSIQYIQSNLMDNYDVKHVHLDIKLERTSVDVAGNATLLLQSKINGLDTIALELLQVITVDSVKVNTLTVSNYEHINDHLYIPCTPFGVGNLIKAQVYYHGTPPSNGFFSGMSNSVNSQVTWSLSESFHGRDWWPCKQILNDKIDSVDVWITTDSANKAGSNGLLRNVTNLGNKKRYEWHSDYMINYYLISVCVARYIEYNIYAHPAALAGDSILIQNYLYNQTSLNANKTNIDKTALYIEKFSEVFGLYPFWKEKYGHCQSQLGGGEEHQTMTTIGGFGNDLVDHELGHQWWGDNVTCATWRDIFINEGFASYCEYVGLEKTGTAAQALAKIKGVQNTVMSDVDGSVYVPLTSAYDEGRIFDSRLTYDKGAAIIHMMRFEAQNDSLFFLALRNFQNQYKDSVATGEDLKTVLENTIGISYSDFFNQWYYGEGYPKYALLWNQQNDTLTLTVNQTSSASVTPLFKMLMEYKLRSVQGDTLVRVYQTANSNVFKFKLNGKTISQVVVDPNFWVLKKITTNQQNTGINDLMESNIRLYPSPADDRVYLELSRNSSNTSVFIFDLSGREVKQVKVQQSPEVIDISGLAAGAYVLKIQNKEGISIRKFNKL